MQLLNQRFLNYEFKLKLNSNTWISVFMLFMIRYDNIQLRIKKIECLYKIYM